MHQYIDTDVIIEETEYQMTTYTAIFSHSEGWIVGHMRELPGAIVQERTIEEARESLKEVIALILEARAAQYLCSILSFQREQYAAMV